MKVVFFPFSKNISSTFKNIFCIAKERDIDFCVLSNQISKVKLNSILGMEGVHSVAISVGVGQITGTGFNFSPKLPYVSEDGIIINVKRCVELGIPDRIKNTNIHSHFEDAGGIHAALLSFLEAIVPHGELYIYPYIYDSKKLLSFKARFIASILKRVKSIFNLVSYEIREKRYR